MRNVSKILVLTSSILAISMMASVSHAQSTNALEGENDEEVTDAENAGSKSKRASDGSIIVEGVARRLSSAGAFGSRTNLDTPFSVSQVGAEDIKDRQAYSLQDVFATDAAISRNGGSDFNAWSSRLIIRGLPIDFADSVKINGMSVYLFGINLPLDAMEQVEMLKGSAGFMYGFGAPGGIINYVTKKPPVDGDILGFNVGYHSGGVKSGSADLGTRFGPNEAFGIRVNVSGEDGDTYTNSHITRGSAQAAVDVRITDNLTWNAEALYQDSDLEHPVPYIQLTRAPYVSDLLPDPVSSDDLLVSEESLNRDKFLYVRTGLDLSLGDDWNASADLSHDRLDRYYPSDYFWLQNEGGDYTEYVYNGAAIWTYDSAQVMVEGKFDTGPFSHQIVFGGHWLRQVLDQSNTATASILGTSNLYDPVNYGWSPTEASQLTYYRNSQYIQKALFASDTISYDDKLSLILGGRFTDYGQKRFNASGVALSEYETEVVTPTVALMFKPAPRTTLYASYVQSLEPGSVVGATYANANEMLDPLLSKQIEVGFKVDRRNWNLQGALFQIDRGATYITDDNYYVQSGNLRYRGAEISGKFSLSDEFRVGASVVYVDGTYEKTNSEWLVGRKIPGTAPFSASLMAEADVAAIPGLSILLDGKYTGKTVAYQYEPSGVTLKTADYAIFNANMRYRADVSGHTVILRAGLQNLFDKKYWQGGENVLAVGAARTFAVNLQFEM